MRIGSQAWYDAHPDAPSRVDLAEDAAFEREARARGYQPPPVTGAFADALAQAKENAKAASREQ